MGNSVVKDINSEYKEIIKMIKKLSLSHRIQDVFSDFVEIMALRLQTCFLMGKARSKNQSRYEQIINNYTESDKELIQEIIKKVAFTYEDNPFRDVLGELYMQLNLENKLLGQCFTPQDIGLLMAGLTIDIDATKEAISQGKRITISEPCVGSGTNVIAMCQYLYENGINYSKHCLFICQEIDRLAALMCYVSLNLNGCNAVIKIGDELGDPYTSYFEEIAKGSELLATPLFYLTLGHFESITF